MIMTNAEVGYMTAVAAIHAHPKADFDKAAAQLTNMWFNALGNMPYMTGGKTGDDMVSEERDAAIKRFKKWKLEPTTIPGAEQLTPRENTE
jgi:hypothetical protein